MQLQLYAFSPHRIKLYWWITSSPLLITYISKLYFSSPLGVTKLSVKEYTTVWLAGPLELNVYYFGEGPTNVLNRIKSVKSWREGDECLKL